MISGIIESKPDNVKKVFYFFLKLIAIWLFWKIILHITGEEHVPLQERMIPSLSYHWESLNNAVRHIVLHGSESLLNILGYITENTGYALRVKGERGLALGNYCLGFQLMYYFAMLVLISSLNYRTKFLAVISVAPIVIVLNIFRVAILCLVLINRPAMLPVIHHYVFNGIVLGILLGYYFALIRNSKK